jgi:hypothetical protein
MLNGFSSVTQNFFSLMVFMILFAACSAIIWSTIRLPAEAREKKHLFNFRVLLYPLSYYSFVAGSSIMVIHSLEHIAIFDRMNSNSAIKKETKSFLSRLAVYLLIIVGVIYTVDFSFTLIPGNSLSSQPIWFAAITSILFSMQLMHYFLERRIFRQRELETAKYVRPLLAG